MKWSTVQLGDVCDVIAGGTPKRSEPTYWGGDVPWVKISDMLQGYLKHTDETITKHGLDSSAAKLLPAGTVLISIFATIGRTATLGIEAATNQAIVGVIPKNPGIFNLRYLEYCLGHKAIEWKRKARGVAQLNINGKILKSTKIPLPPLAEQKRIAGILDAADALRAKRRESIEQLDRLIQSTFLEMFGDPVTNPKGWDTVPFCTLGESRLGKMLDAAKQTETDQYPYLANFNVQWNRFVLDQLREMSFSAADRVEFSLETGDLLICEGGEVGRSAIWRGEKENVFFQKALHRVRLDTGVALPEYILWYMWFMAKHNGFRQFMTSVTIAHLTGIKLKKLPVPLPPIELQQEFATISHSIESKNEQTVTHFDELDTLFASLQSQAFSGAL